MTMENLILEFRESLEVLSERHDIELPSAIGKLRDMAITVESKRAFGELIGYLDDTLSPFLEQLPKESRDFWGAEREVLQIWYERYDEFVGYTQKFLSIISGVAASLYMNSVPLDSQGWMVFTEHSRRISVRLYSLITLGPDVDAKLSICDELHQLLCMLKERAALVNSLTLFRSFPQLEADVNHLFSLAYLEV